MSTGPSSLRLNRKDARWLGVCAGIADWLDVPAVLVRVIFVICVLSWPTLIIGYFLLYFCLDKDITPDKMRDYFQNANTAEHFRQLNYRKPIYKNERNKRIAGVCSGIADYFEVSAFAVRAVTLFSLFVFGPYTVMAYIVCMIVFDPDPHAPHTNRYERKLKRKKRRAERRSRRARKSYANEEYQNFSEASSEGEAADLETETYHADDMDDEQQRPFSYRECTEVYSSLELRLREIEAYMTSKKFRLHCEINRI